MKELNQANLISEYQRKRRNKKIIKGLLAFGLVLITIIMMIIYFYFESTVYISCKETSSLNYKTYLKDNNFYEGDYVEEGTNVIASLIKDIKTNFKYDLSLEREQEFTYSYRITGKLEVLENDTEDTVFEKEEDLIAKSSKNVSADRLNIDETLDIDYEKYNEKLSKFVQTFSLNDTTNRLVLTMYLYVNSTYDGSQINKDVKVMTMEIPLTTQTVDIGITTDGTENEGKVLVNKENEIYAKYTLVITILFGVLALIALIRFFRYLSSSRTAETMYEQSLKGIMLNYKNYIQRVADDVKGRGYEKIEVKTFNELILMRDVVNSPVLMFTEGEYRTKFMIVNDKRLFYYVLDAQLIREELREKSRQKNK